MQVKVSTAAPAVAFDRPNTTNDRLGSLDGGVRPPPRPGHGQLGVFEQAQNPIIVGQAAYNTAYGTDFAATGWCNPSAPSTPQPAKCDGFARIQSRAATRFKFDTLSRQPALAIPLPTQGHPRRDELGQRSTSSDA